jgi:hypothetical protein
VIAEKILSKASLVTPKSALVAASFLIKLNSSASVLAALKASYDS